jgi:hypothetical protein
MATATATAPTITTPRTRRTVNATNDPNAKRFQRALRLWATALDALTAAADACDEMAEAMADLPPDDSERIHGEEAREDAWHIAWHLRSDISLLESECPHAAVRLTAAYRARRAS